MKLQKGLTIYYNNHKYIEEIPDNIAEELGLVKPKKHEPDKKRKEEIKID